MTQPSSSFVQVLKFGSSVLRTEDDLPDVAAEVHRRVRAGIRPVVIVSAFRGRTDQLVQLADRLDAEGHDRAALLALGEQESAAIAAAALRRAGLPVRLITVDAIGIVADGDAVDASPVVVAPEAIAASLAAGEIPVVPGYVARNAGGEPVVLGRGGSDLTAIGLAAALAAEVVLLKGPGAVYEWDPEIDGPPPRRFAALDYADAIEVGEQVIQPRAVRHAREHAVDVVVTGLRGRDATVVHGGPTRLEDATPQTRIATPRRRVALLGVGTVGGGVASLLARHPGRFELVGGLVRNPARDRSDLPVGLRLTTDPNVLFDQEPDLVVETLGGVEVAGELVRRSLESGADVVTANKALVAELGNELEMLARTHGRRILTSACVGGGLPALELAALAHARGEVIRITGVLNGTSSFVLDRLSKGWSFEDAIEDARRRGYAEADVSADLEGFDAACKLVLLGRAIGVEDLCPDSIPCETLDVACAEAIRGTTVRQVAELVLRNGRAAAAVRLQPLSSNDPLAVAGAGNAIAITLADGSVLRSHATGAGRWPTAHSVFADVDDLADSSVRRLDVGSDDGGVSSHSSHSLSSHSY